MALLALLFPLLVFSQLASCNPAYRDLVELAELLDHEKRYSKEEQGDFIKVCQQEPIELALVIDASRSIDYRDFDKGQDFLINFVSDYDVGPGKTQVRVCAVTFGHGVYEDDAFNLNTYKTKDQVLDALKKMPFRSGGRTDTGDAIKYMREQQMARTRDVPKIAVVITDGNSQRRSYTKEQADLARADNITVFAIGVGHYVSDVELLNIGGDQSRVIKVDNYDSLEKIKELLAHKTCVMKPKPTTSTTTTTTTTTPPTTPPMAEPCSDAYPADIQFVFNPASLGADATSWVTQFIAHTINNEELEKGFQYGVTSGLCPDDAGFPLNRYQTTGDIRQHLDRYDRNSLPELVRQARTTAFTAQTGARPADEASRVVVIFLGKAKMDTEKLRSEIKALQDAGVQVFVASADSGVSVKLPEGAQLLSEGSSLSQSVEFVQRICNLGGQVF